MNYDGKAAMPYFGSSSGDYWKPYNHLEIINISNIMDDTYRNFSSCIHYI